MLGKSIKLTKSKIKWDLYRKLVTRLIIPGFFFPGFLSHVPVLSLPKWWMGCWTGPNKQTEAVDAQQVRIPTDPKISEKHTRVVGRGTKVGEKKSGKD